MFNFSFIIVNNDKLNQNIEICLSNVIKNLSERKFEIIFDVLFDFIDHAILYSDRQSEKILH